MLHRRNESRYDGGGMRLGDKGHAPRRSRGAKKGNRESEVAQAP